MYYLCSVTTSFVCYESLIYTWNGLLNYYQVFLYEIQLNIKTIVLKLSFS